MPGKYVVRLVLTGWPHPNKGRQQETAKKHRLAQVVIVDYLFANRRLENKNKQRKVNKQRGLGYDAATAASERQQRNTALDKLAIANSFANTREHGTLKKKRHEKTEKGNQTKKAGGLGDGWLTLSHLPSFSVRILISTSTAVLALCIVSLVRIKDYHEKDDVGRDAQYQLSATFASISPNLIIISLYFYHILFLLSSPVFSLATSLFFLFTPNLRTDNKLVAANSHQITKRVSCMHIEI